MYGYMYFFNRTIYMIENMMPISVAKIWPHKSSFPPAANTGSPVGLLGGAGSWGDSRESLYEYPRVPCCGICILEAGAGGDKWKNAELKKTPASIYIYIYV